MKQCPSSEHRIDVVTVTFNQSCSFPPNLILTLVQYTQCSCLLMFWCLHLATWCIYVVVFSCVLMLITAVLERASCAQGHWLFSHTTASSFQLFSNFRLIEEAGRIIILLLRLQVDICQITFIPVYPLYFLINAEHRVRSERRELVCSVLRERPEEKAWREGTKAETTQTTINRFSNANLMKLVLGFIHCRQHNTLIWETCAKRTSARYQFVQSKVQPCLSGVILWKTEA